MHRAEVATTKNNL